MLLLKITQSFTKCSTFFSFHFNWLYYLHYIYIYSFGRCFYPERLTSEAEYGLLTGATDNRLLNHYNNATAIHG